MMKSNTFVVYIFVNSCLVSNVTSEVIEVKVPYTCHTNEGCQRQPMGDYSTNCFKEKICTHQFTIANQSEARWFYAVIDEDATKNTALHYEALPSFAFAEYNWQKSSGRVTKARSEWDPNFNRMEDPMPADPADFKINDQYVVLALSEPVLKRALKKMARSKKRDNNEGVIVVKLVADKAFSKHPPASGLAIVGATIGPESVKFLSGWIEAASIEKQDMTKITLQNRPHKP